MLTHHRHPRPRSDRGRDLILLELSALHPTEEDDGDGAAAFVGAATVGVPSFDTRGKQSTAAAADAAPASLVLRDARGATVGGVTVHTSALHAGSESPPARQLIRHGKRMVPVTSTDSGKFYYR